MEPNDMCFSYTAEPMINQTLTSSEGNISHCVGEGENYIKKICVYLISQKLYKLNYNLVCYHFCCMLT